MNGSCSTKAIDPFFINFPEQKGISPKIAAKKVDFPEPTLPVIPTKDPNLMFIFTFYNDGLPSGSFFQ